MNELEQLFDEEVARIRANPETGKEWCDTYQGYLRSFLQGGKRLLDSGERKTAATTVNYKRIGHRFAEIGISYSDGKVMVIIRLQKADCLKEPHERLYDADMDRLERPLPDDLQKVLLEEEK